MADVKDDRRIPCWIVPVRVFACLRTNWLGSPFDLRMPNSEFLILSRRDTDEIVKVLRVGEEVDGARFSIENKGFI